METESCYCSPYAPFVENFEEQDSKIIKLLQQHLYGAAEASRRGSTGNSRIH
ncbi:uncharacterized protein G2W53_029157 [Senna tora]|uniref:Uncharacterized protein n=1 Tax=Senna tora TaxID=362788 RepID=A0A834T4S9_9FABA|nr:uncharacterized protein G2W53_029157 [Senna tora]